MLEWSRCAAATSDYVTRRHGFQAELCVEVYSFQTSQANEKQTWAFASLCGQQPSVFHFSLKGIFFSLLFFSWTSLRFVFVSFSLLLLKWKSMSCLSNFFKSFNPNSIFTASANDCSVCLCDYKCTLLGDCVSVRVEVVRNSHWVSFNQSQDSSGFMGCRTVS